MYEHCVILQTKQKYETAMLVLENTIQTQKTQITKQTQVIENLFQQKDQLNKHIKKLEQGMLTNLF